MLVAGQHDDVVEPAHARQQAAARHVIGGPGVEVEDFSGSLRVRRSRVIIMICWARQFQRVSRLARLA